MFKKLNVLVVMAAISLSLISCGGATGTANQPDASTVVGGKVTANNLEGTWTNNNADVNDIATMAFTKVNDTTLNANVTLGDNTTGTGVVTLSNVATTTSVKTSTLTNRYVSIFFDNGETSTAFITINTDCTALNATDSEDGSVTTLTSDRTSCSDL
ncbi:MAG: hypothetical protein ABIE74_06745 [Pseudomonadota bacterium]